MHGVCITSLAGRFFADSLLPISLLQPLASNFPLELLLSASSSLDDGDEDEEEEEELLPDDEDELLEDEDDPD